MKDELQTIKAHHDSLPGPAPQVAARAWDLLTAGAEAERAGGGPRRPAGWRLRRSPGPGRIALRAGVAVGLAAAVTAGVVMVRVDDGPSLLGVQPANAAELLQHAAAVAAEGDPQPRPDQFLYVDRKDVTQSFGFGPSTGRYEYTQDVRREVWIPAADPGKALARSRTETSTGALSRPKWTYSPPERWSTSAPASAIRTSCARRRGVPAIFPPTPTSSSRRSARTRKRSSARTGPAGKRLLRAETRSTAGSKESSR